MSARFRVLRRPRLRGFSLLEVLVSMAILLTGIVVIVGFLPVSLRSNQKASDVSIAAYLAQQKAEEIRRDNTSSGQLVSEIQSLTTPTSPLVFPTNPNFVYQFCGVSLIDPVDDPNDPRDDVGVARIIVSYAPSYRPQGGILYELRFGN
jgi:prepilin-type N-terminal cleavage/methylation domain-containing protein